MKFEKLPLAWNNEGVEPPQSLKNSGFTAGDKPPADYMNCFMNKTYEAINELQTEVEDHTHTEFEIIDVRKLNLEGNNDSSVLRNISGTYSDGSEYSYLNVDTEIAEQGVMLKEKYVLRERQQRCATITVVANDALNKYGDIICSGNNDEEAITEAIDRLPSTGGKIYLSEGTYNINNSFYIEKNNVFIEGMNDSTILNINKNCNIRLFGNNVSFKNMKIIVQEADNNAGSNIFLLDQKNNIKTDEFTLDNLTIEYSIISVGINVIRFVHNMSCLEIKNCRFKKKIGSSSLLKLEILDKSTSSEYNIDNLLVLGNIGIRGYVNISDSTADLYGNININGGE